MSHYLRRAQCFLTALVVLFTASWATAGQLLPNPANGSPASAGPENGFTVSLIPNPVSYRSPAIGCPWLLPAAQTANQPYNNATNVWNFSYAANFNGTFTLNTYAATNDGVGGGADFKITYTPGADDPSGANVRWMQVIDTNMPSPRGTKYGVAGTGANGVPTGTTAYLDNEGPNPKNGSTRPNTGWVPRDPYYGWLTVPNGAAGSITDSTAATSTSFLDEPFLPLAPGRLWEAQTFVVGETDTTAMVRGVNVTTHTVTIYGGVWWGFQDTRVVPEPETWVLLVSGCAVIGFMRRRDFLSRFCSAA